MMRFLKMGLLLAALALWLALPAEAAATGIAGIADGATAYRVLVFSKTLGYRHDSITNGIAALRQLGLENGSGRGSPRGRNPIGASLLRLPRPTLRFSFGL